MKIILLTQDTDLPGGVANFFRILKKRFQADLEYHVTGSRHPAENKMIMLRRLYKDYHDYMFSLRFFDLVHLNTSLRIKSVYRDGLFLLISKAFGKKVLLFIHGWNPDLEQKIETKYLWLYRSIFFKANQIIVLSEQFKQKLLKWGFTGKIQVLSTVVDDELLHGFAYEEILQKSHKEVLNILFLARLEKEKGIYQTLDAYAVVKKKYPFVSLTIAGVGKELHNAIKYAKDKNIPDVSFPGFVQDQEKQAVFKQADLFCFPTNYGEGMPTNVIEAMAFGLPVISKPVGGLNDFFVEGKMGFLLDTDDPLAIASLLENLILDVNLRRSISLYNYNYSKEHFLASKIVAKLEKFYAELHEK